MALKLITAAAETPITLAEAKTALGVTGSSEDALITSLLTAAISIIEGRDSEHHLALVTQTWDFYLDEFPEPDVALRIPLPPLQSIGTVVYVDDGGTEQTWAASKYRVDEVSRPARLTPVYGESWPTTRVQTNAIRIRFTAGFGGASAVPDVIKAAIKLILADLYRPGDGDVLRRRVGPTEVEYFADASNRNRKSVDQLLGNYRVWSYAA